VSTIKDSVARLAVAGANAIVERSVSVNAEVIHLLAGYSADVQTLARRTRSFILELLPRADERADPAARVIGYGRGNGYKGLVCTMILSAKGVKLGIVNGASLPDPTGLLEGSGKVHKYVPIASVETLGNPALRALLEAAAAQKKP
jgi:hypothetical protein